MKKIIGIFILVVILLSVTYYFVNQEESSYSSEIVSYTENGSYVEFPRIDNIKDEQMQDEINKLLKNQVFYGAKNYNYQTFVDFSHPNYRFDFSSGIGITNKNIASFWYSFSGYGEVRHEDGGVMRETYRHYGITVDMKTGEKINLSDFMEIDERLINSNNGNTAEYDYNSPVNLQYNKFKDAFMVFTSDDEEDSYHVFSVQSTIEMLKDDEAETIWYIDDNKNIVFIFDKNSISIPYSEISDLIYPKYLKAIEE